MHRYSTRVSFAVILAALAAAPVSAVPVAATDLDSLRLGPKIVGPVGPEVDATFVNAGGDGVGDLISSVSCPDGFAACMPPNNPQGTIYTYAHTATPGVDLPNDPPFPSPDTILPLDDVTQFGLGFAAEGFNGVAGFSFSEAAAAVGTPGAVAIERLDDGSLVWSVSTDDWDTGEPITFFWQTMQPPSGPGGIYAISNALTSGSGNGPLPIPVPEPGSAVLVGFAAIGVLWRSGRCRRRLVEGSAQG